jgi:hypothetical protein
VKIRADVSVKERGYTILQRKEAAGSGFLF